MMIIRAQFLIQSCGPNSRTCILVPKARTGDWRQLAKKHVYDHNLKEIITFRGYSSTLVVFHDFLDNFSSRNSCCDLRKDTPKIYQTGWSPLHPNGRYPKLPYAFLRMASLRQTRSELVKECGCVETDVQNDAVRWGGRGVGPTGTISSYI